MALSVNGAFGLIDSSTVIGGRTVEGITAINYDVTREKTNQYGASGRVYSRARKKKTVEGSMTLYFRECRAMIESAVGAVDLTDIPPFDIVMMVRSTEGELVKQILKDVEFTAHPTNLEEDQEDIEVEAPFIFTQVING
jgi:hypothetical protein